MKNLILLTAMFPLSVFATDVPRQAQDQAQGQIQGQAQGQGQIQGQSVDTDSYSSSFTSSTVGIGIETNYNSPDKVKYAGSYELKNVPAVIAPNIYPTSPCMGSYSAGVGVVGWGASAGGTKVNHECVMLETARVFSQLGYPTQGLEVMCATEVAMKVFGSNEACKAGVLHEAAVASPSVLVIPAGMSREEVQQSVDRAFKTAVSK